MISLIITGRLEEVISEADMRNVGLIDTYRSRLEDYHRHLVDLRDLAYEGSVEREQREATFQRAVELLSPVVREVLEEFNEIILDNTGNIEWREVESDGDDGLVSMWLMSWPLQQAAHHRSGGIWQQDSEPTSPPVLKETPEESIDPIIVRAFLPKEGVTGWIHGHIAGSYHSQNSMWPLNVLTPDDAKRQAIVVWMIAEGELHRCTYDLGQAAMTLLPKW